MSFDREGISLSQSPRLTGGLPRRRMELARPNRNPTVGRQLAGLASRSGLRIEHLEGLAVCYRDLEQADRVFPPRRAAGQAASDDVITYAAASEWIEDLEASSTSGGLLLSITIFTVVATKHFQAENRSH